MAASFLGPRILSFLNLSFFDRPRGTRVKGGWHSEKGSFVRWVISIIGKFEEYVFVYVEIVRDLGRFGVLDGRVVP